jgi:O-antigen ligase
MLPSPRWWDRARRIALTAFVVSLPLSISGAEIALGVLLALTVASLARGWIRWIRTPLDRPLLVFLSILVISTLWGGPTAAALDAYRGLWVMGAYVATAGLVTDAAEARRLGRVFVLTATAVAAYGIVQHFTGVDVYRTLAGREIEVKPYEHDPTRFAVIGFFPSYLTFAHSMLIPLGFAVAAAIGPAVAARRGASAVCALLMGVALVLSTARGAWIAAGAMVLAAALVAGRRARVGMLVGAALVGALLVLSVPGLRSEARSLVDRKANARREAIYAANLDLLADHPVLGVGFGNYERRAPEYYARHPLADRRSHAHNSFLQIAAEAGGVGLAAFCWIFGRILAVGRRLRRWALEGRPELWAPAVGGWLGVVGFLVGGLTQHTFGDSECVMPLWFAVGVLAVLHREATGASRNAHSAR